MPAPNADNTHNPAAQASAGRLIILLRNELDPFESSRAELKPRNELGDERLSQIEKVYLIALLKTKSEDINSSTIKDSEGNILSYPVTPTTSICIPGINAFINYIKEHQQEPPFNEAGAIKAVFSEMTRMINQGCDEFTKNRIYIDGQEKLVDASLGETLGLVCSALHGEDVSLQLHYQDIVERDLKPNETLEIRLASELHARMLSLFQCLKELSTDKKCTGGRQHDLLYLLNGVYPELKENGKCEPVLLIEDVNDFILGTLLPPVGSII